MTGLRLYAALGLLWALLGLVGAVWWQSQRIDTLKAQADALAGRLATCSARIENIQEDNRSDTEIDRLDPADLFNVPDRWLSRPGAGD